MGSSALTCLVTTFLDYLPEPVLARLREFRNSWNNRRFQIAIGAS